MENSQSYDCPTSQVNLFMAGITKDLEEHVTSTSRKYAFDFGKEEPMEDVEGDFQWLEVSNFSKSEVGGKKPTICVFADRKSTADTDKLYTNAHLNTSIISQDGYNLGCRQSSLFKASSFSEQQAHSQRFAILKQPTHTLGNKSIPEECEETPSPSQGQSYEAEMGRESLIERPEIEGRVQNPFLLNVQSPFKAGSSVSR